MMKKSDNNCFRVVILALCIVAIPNYMKAQFSGGDGTSENPYQITTVSEFVQLATYVNAGNAIYAVTGVHYQLTTNISLSTSWTPIGNTTNPFKGVFDGDNNQITNLSANAMYTGLFGCIDVNATVKNIGLVDVNINSTGITVVVGGLVGENKGTISNCYSTGVIKRTIISTATASSSAHIGGLVGLNQGSVLNCYSTCTITVPTSSDPGFARSYAGGVIGYNQNNGNVSNCYATGAVTTSATCNTNVIGNVYSYSYAGGVMGLNEGVISNCYSTGAVSATSRIDAPSSPRTIYAYSCAGGVVGYNFVNGNVSNCYSIGAVSASSTSSSTAPYGYKYSDTRPYSYVGGVIGYNANSECSVSNCAALNSKISCRSTPINGVNNTTYRYYGRVVGSNTGTLTNNIAFDNMINPSNTTTWSNIGLSNISGASYTINDINMDDTLGGRFTTPVWTTQNGKLPGLFGETVNMPEHLYIAPTPPTITTTTLSDGVINTAYSQILSAIGTMPIIWAIENENSLPNWLFLTGDTISGMSDTAGTFLFSVIATNSAGSDTAQLSITIAKATQTAPGAPTLADKTFTTISLNTILGCEYNINDGTYQSSPIFSELMPSTSYTFMQRKAETATHLASPESMEISFVTDSAILTGEITISDNAIFGQNLTVNTSNLTSTPDFPNLGMLSYQWKRNTTNIGTNSSYTLGQADIGNTITVTITAANCAGSVTSNPTTTVIKATQTTPAAPTLNSNTSTSITLNSVTGCEYRRDSGNWQVSTIFRELEPNTFYSFTQRKAETAIYLESSESQVVEFKTSGGVGVNEILLENIMVYPNPTNGMLKIASGKLKIRSVSIFDIFGKNIVINTPISPKNLVSENVIDISHLSAGIYFVILTTETGKIVKKITKE